MRAVILRVLPLVALLAGFALIEPAAAADKEDEGFAPIFNGKDWTGLKKILGGKDADPDKTWSIKEGVILCTGKPSGYFYTDKSYKNYVLRFDWKYARPESLKDEEKFGGNSGCLVHIQEPHKVWPKCVEVQGQNLTHGNIFAIGGAKGKFKFDKAVLQKARHKVGDWNTTEIICKDGAITSKVNGTEVSSGTSDDVKEGTIGFQSEGAEIHFRNLRIKETK